MIYDSLKHLDAYKGIHPGVLRALELPAGRHTVEWRYRAPHWALAEGITLLFSLATLAAFVITLIYSIRNERRQKIEA